jgi:hypothetical protein
VRLNAALLPGMYERGNKGRSVDEVGGRRRENDDRASDLITEWCNALLEGRVVGTIRAVR